MVTYTAWSADVTDLAREVLRTRIPSLSAFLRLMERFRDVYPLFVSNGMARRLLHNDIGNGIRITRAAQERLACADTVPGLLQATLDAHAGDRSRCKDRQTSGIVALTWLNRVLWFVTAILQDARNDGEEKPIGTAYQRTISAYHTRMTSRMLRLFLSSKRNNGAVRTLARTPTTSSVLAALQAVYIRIHTQLVQHGVHFTFRV